MGITEVEVTIKGFVIQFGNVCSVKAALGPRCLTGFLARLYSDHKILMSMSGETSSIDLFERNNHTSAICMSVIRTRQQSLNDEYTVFGFLWNERQNEVTRVTRHVQVQDGQ